MVRGTLSKKIVKWYAVCGEDLSWEGSEGSLTAIAGYNCIREGKYNA